MSESARDSILRFQLSFETCTTLSPVKEMEEERRGDGNGRQKWRSSRGGRTLEVAVGSGAISRDGTWTPISSPLANGC